MPLKLTSIAATPEMPILVWVLGDGRAVPKNFIHAVVNEQALTYPGAQNYIDVVTEAVDTVQGRAWVTEYAQPANKNFKNRFVPSFMSNYLAEVDEVTGVTTLLDLWQRRSGLGLLDADARDAY